MTPEQWAEVKTRFHEALERPSTERETFLLDKCSSETVRREVSRLLREHSQSDEFLTWPAVSPVLRAAFRDDDFQDTERFKIQKPLGAGTFGIVFKAFDKERNSVVALKKLLHYEPALLTRFKREFRSLVDLVHPNLVQLYELFGENDRWYFTMEFVDGLDFLAYVRPGRLNTDWDRLRSALSQLATGVEALHSSERLHRDLKPSNVLVTPEGRVVILDFGLVRELATPMIEQSMRLAGSPAYMAPEQAAGKPIGEAADWYAVGVMLYKAITGELPFGGSVDETLERKQKEDAPRASVLNPDVPKDLDEVCGQLLERNPEAREAGVRFLLDQGQRFVKNPADRSREEFVGRERELQLLKERFAALSSGNRQMVLLEGQSGIGKTSLVSHFLSNLKYERADAVVLRGRCRESEVVPYKALDPIADELVRHLKSLRQAEARALLPRQPELLRRLFPVFGQLEILQDAVEKVRVDLDEHQMRRRAFEALSELFGRMSDQGPVVIAIDDLQWGDLDSIAFLTELVLPANAPAVMLLLSFRTEEAKTSPPLLALRDLRNRLRDANSWVEIEIRGLSEEEGRDLLTLLQKETLVVDRQQMDDILREAKGSPLLMSELLRYAATDREEGGAARPVGGNVLLSEMIRHRAGTLSPTARKLLEALSVAGEPLSKSTLYLAVKVTDDDPAREMWRLVNEHLVRVTGGMQGKLEPFHDEVRKASLSWLSEEDLRRWHSHLAEILQAEDEPDPQRLLRHYRGAGNLPAALKAALAGAQTAEKALAFEQAAHFYSEAIRTGQVDGAMTSELLRKRAEALANAGRGHDAAQCYQQAAEKAQNANDVIELRRQAAEQLMRAGQLDEGIDLFNQLLRSAGIHVPATRLESLVRMLAIRAYIRRRGLAWRERSEAEVPAATLRKMDLLWSGAMALVSTDTIFGSYLQALHMLEALRAGEPFRLAFSFGFAAIYESMGGTREYEHGRKLTSLTVELAERLNNPYLTAMTELSWVGLDFLSGRVEDGMLHCQKAAAGLEKTNRKATAWELGTFNMALIWFLGWGGRIRELSEKVPKLLEDGRARGDVYAEVSTLCSGTAHLVELAVDEPDRAIAGMTNALKKWRETAFDLPHFQGVLACMECHLYAGRWAEARQLILEKWPAIRKSLFTRKSQMQRATLYYARGRTALTEWLGKKDSRVLRRETEHYAKKLKDTGSPWGLAMGKILLAGILAGQRKKAESARLLEQAEEILRQQSLRLMAATVAKRRGELEGGSAGTARIDAANQFMQSEGIAKPERMVALYLPGQWG